MPDILDKWKKGLARTRNATFGRLAAAFGASELTPDVWDDLEAMLIQSDLGVEISGEIIHELQRVARGQGLTHLSELGHCLHDCLLERLPQAPEISFNNHPEVILVVGVNGSGKTTTIAKLADKYHKAGKKILLVAADTYRAAAVDQLQIWGERLGIPVIAGQKDADPGAVAYDGIQAAIARQVDMVLVDTAGRLHTRVNLMEELKKVHRVVGKALPGAPHQTWLVLDATTGQNALSQASAFLQAVQVTGIILAKLDTSAKGGMVFSIQRQLGLPILFAGLGESTESLVAFDREAYVNGILEGFPKSPGE